MSIDEPTIRADEREKTMRMLAKAVSTFAPDLAAQLIQRWANKDVAAEAFLTFLREYK